MFFYSNLITFTTLSNIDNNPITSFIQHTVHYQTSPIILKTYYIAYKIWNTITFTHCIWPLCLFSCLSPPLTPQSRTVFPIFLVSWFLPPMNIMPWPSSTLGHVAGIYSYRLVIFHSEWIYSPTSNVYMFGSLQCMLSFYFWSFWEVSYCAFILHFLIPNRV